MTKLVCQIKKYAQTDGFWSLTLYVISQFYTLFYIINKCICVPKILPSRILRYSSESYSHIHVQEMMVPCPRNATRRLYWHLTITTWSGVGTHLVGQQQSQGTFWAWCMTLGEFLSCLILSLLKLHWDKNCAFAPTWLTASGKGNEMDHYDDL